MRREAKKMKEEKARWEEIQRRAAQKEKDKEQRRERWREQQERERRAAQAAWERRRAAEERAAEEDRQRRRAEEEARQEGERMRHQRTLGRFYETLDIASDATLQEVMLLSTRDGIGVRSLFPIVLLLFDLPRMRWHLSCEACDVVCLITVGKGQPFTDRAPCVLSFTCGHPLSIVVLFLAFVCHNRDSPLWFSISWASRSSTHSSHSPPT